MTSIPDEGQQVLAVMPLHAITAVYGEQGLRTRLAIETARLDDLPSRAKISEALELAGDLHAADRRQREPYVNHLLRVALRIICHYGVRDPDVICAALLHDAVEDHASDLAAAGDRAEALAVLAARFGPQVATLVEAVTNPVYLPGQDKDEQYRAHVAASLAANPHGRVIKVSDFTDNGVGIIHTTGPKAVRLAHKYAPLVPVLAGLIARPDTPLAPHVKVRILGQLRTAQQRFAAIVPPAPAGPSALVLQPMGLIAEWQAQSRARRASALLAPGGRVRSDSAPRWRESQGAALSVLLAEGGLRTNPARQDGARTSVI